MLDQKELKDFINFSQKKWPTVRSKYIKLLKPRCVNCIASSAYATLDSNALLCEACIEFNKSNPIKKQYDFLTHNLELQEQLEHVIKAAQEKENPYDALLLFSGGKDSIYLLNMLIKKYENIKILTLFIDNGFQSEIATKNIEESLKLYPNIDHVYFKPHKNLYANMFHYIIQHADELNGYSKVDDFDGFLTFDIALNLAYRLGIPIVFAGLNAEQAKEYYKTELIQPVESLQFKRSTLFGIDIREFHTKEESLSWWDGINKSIERIPKLIFPLAIEGRSELNIIFDLLGLNLIELSETHPFYTNNTILPFLMYLDFKKYGFSNIEPKLTRMIRRKEADKIFWLKHLEAIEYLVLKDEFFKKSIKKFVEDLKLDPRLLDAN